MNAPSYTFAPDYLSGSSAWTAHLPFAYDLIKIMQPSVFVELGTWNGDSFFTFCQSVKENRLSTVCYAVDLWTGDEMTGAADSVQFSRVQSYCSENYRSFAYLMRTDFASASREFSDGQISLLHIDGLHTYEAAASDFATWFPKVREGGIVLFHDISVRSSKDHVDFGVWKIWEELKAKHKTFEFNHGFGLGILVKGENPGATAWLAKVMDEYKFYYSTRGIDMQRIADGMGTIELLTAQIHKLHGAMAGSAAGSAALLKESGEREERLHIAIEQWNGRSWFKRAFHKLRVPR